MPFEYGNPGRPPGAKNKRTQLWETLEELLMGEGLEKFQNELMELEGKEYINAYLAVIEYFKPRLSRTTFAGDSENPLPQTFTVNVIHTNHELSYSESEAIDLID